jgi:hypothetical protein
MMTEQRRGRGAPPSLSPDEWEEAIERYKSGEKVQDLAKDFRVSTGTMGSGLRTQQIQKEIGSIRDKNLSKFASEARSILWRVDSGKDEKHPLYHEWKDRVHKFQTRHKCSYGAAVIQATKFYRKCWKLFLKYDVEQFDKYPESHPAVTQYKSQLLKDGVSKNRMKNEGIDQGHKDNLAWAIAAAGEEARTGVPPESCPNDAAYFLYQQAIASPEAFLARFTSIESKTSGKDEPGRLTAKRAVEEINGLLSTLLNDTDEEGEAVPMRLA